MYRYSTLENISYDNLYKIFIEIFEDFPIVKETDINGFCNMLKENKYDSTISKGVFHFETGELIGFILNGIKSNTMENTVYLILTGIKPTYRRQGLMKNLFENMKLLLQQKDFLFYVTEVLVTNTSALGFYQAQGFKIQKGIIIDVKINNGVKKVEQYEITLNLSQTK